MTGQQVAQLLTVSRLAQPGQCLGFHLSDPLLAYPPLSTDLSLRLGKATFQPIVRTDHLGLRLRQSPHQRQQALAHVFPVLQLCRVCSRLIIIQPQDRPRHLPALAS